MGSDKRPARYCSRPGVLAELGISHEVRVLSAHRTPHDMLSYAAGARDRGIAGADRGRRRPAHLPGMLASATVLPVIRATAAHLDGLDSLLSIAQMPAGVPVATVAIGAARNAGLLAARILAIGDPNLRAHALESVRMTSPGRPAQGRARSRAPSATDPPQGDTCSTQSA